MKSNQNGNPDIELELNYLIQKRREIDKYLDVRDTELTHDDRVHVIFRLSQMSKSSNNFTFEEHSIQNKITDTMILVNVFIHYYNTIILENLKRISTECNYEINQLQT